jgi:hypothetical protein
MHLQGVTRRSLVQVVANVAIVKASRERGALDVATAGVITVALDASGS